MKAVLVILLVVVAASAIGVALLLMFSLALMVHPAFVFPISAVLLFVMFELLDRV